MSLDSISIIQSLCPNCSDNIPNIYYTDSLSIECNCGYAKDAISIEDYMTNYQPSNKRLCSYQSKCDKHNITYKYYCIMYNNSLCEKCLVNHKEKVIRFGSINKKIKELKAMIDKGYNHINKYFQSLYDETIRTERKKRNNRKFSVLL